MQYETHSPVAVTPSMCQSTEQGARGEFADPASRGLRGRTSVRNEQTATNLASRNSYARGRGRVRACVRVRTHICTDVRALSRFVVVHFDRWSERRNAHAILLAEACKIIFILVGKNRAKGDGFPPRSFFLEKESKRRLLCGMLRYRRRGKDARAEERLKVLARSEGGILRRWVARSDSRALSRPQDRSLSPRRHAWHAFNYQRFAIPRTSERTNKLLFPLSRSSRGRVFRGRFVVYRILNVALLLYAHARRRTESAYMRARERERERRKARAHRLMSPVSMFSPLSRARRRNPAARRESRV